MSIRRREEFEEEDDEDLTQEDEKKNHIPPTPIPTNKLEIQQQIQVSKKVSEYALRLYMEHKFQESKQQYLQAIKYLEFFLPHQLLTPEQQKKVEISKEEIAKIQKQLSVYYNKLAHCTLKNKEYAECIQMCDSGLSCNTTNHTLYFLRAKAKRHVQMFKEAKQDLETAISMNPGNMDYQVEMKNLEDASRNMTVDEETNARAIRSYQYARPTLAQQPTTGGGSRKRNEEDEDMQRAIEESLRTHQNQQFLARKGGYQEEEEFGMNTSKGKQKANQKAMEDMEEEDDIAE